MINAGDPDDVSTHSHPKVAAIVLPAILSPVIVSTHSHPKVAALSVHEIKS